MHKGPQGQRSPGDADAIAVMVANIATVEIEGVQADRFKAHQSAGGKPFAAIPGQSCGLPNMPRRAA